MKMSRNTVTAILLAVSFTASSFAHHSNAVFNHEQMTILTGTVIKHDFINPHDQIHMSVDEGNGKITTWIVTGGPPAEMRRIGWHAGMFKPGEQLTVKGLAYRDGRPVMIRMRIQRANGEEVSTAGTAASTMFDEFMEKYGKDPQRIRYIGKK